MESQKDRHRQTIFHGTLSVETRGSKKEEIFMKGADLNSSF